MIKEISAYALECFIGAVIAAAIVSLWQGDFMDRAWDLAVSCVIFGSAGFWRGWRRRERSS